jgi:hypothetical protein
MASLALVVLLCVMNRQAQCRTHDSHRRRPGKDGQQAKTDEALQGATHDSSIPGLPYRRRRPRGRARPGAGPGVFTEPDGT